MTARALAAAAMAAAVLPASASAGLPRDGEHVVLDPADFSTRITNPWWPMRPGSRWVYRETAASGGRQRVSRREQAGVPYGHFRNVLMTREDNPLEPRALEFKFYARGIGPVLAVSVSGGSDREALVRFRRGR